MKYIDWALQTNEVGGSSTLVEYKQLFCHSYLASLRFTFAPEKHMDAGALMALQQVLLDLYCPKSMNVSACT